MKIEAVLLAIFFAIAAVVQWVVWSDKADCENAGGTYVRAVPWFACVGAK